MATIHFVVRNGGGGNDVLGGEVNFIPATDTYLVDRRINGLAGNDSLQSLLRPVSVDGNVLNFAFTLDGGDGNDNLTGWNSATDFLLGGNGNDYISGGSGNDRLDGGAGRDTAQLYSFDSPVRMLVSYAAQAAATVRLGDGSVITGFEAFVLTSGAGNDALDLSGDAEANGSSFFATGGSDILVVDSFTHGAIIFNGGDGADRLSADLSARIGPVTMSPVGGTSGLLNVAGLAVNYVGVDALHVLGGSGKDTLAGGDFADFFEGGAGNDSLDGGLGHDVLRGGAGNDRYTVSEVGDVVTELADGGIDSVASAVTIAALAANVENLTLAGGDAINGAGNELANALTGNSQANILRGLDGDDTILGGSGADTLVGGLDRDVMTGGGAADRFDFNDSIESAPGVSRDRILDFSTFEGDLMDAATIDAKAANDGNQAFTFIAAAVFSAEGQIRAVQSGLNTLIQFNTDGAAAADMEILLMGVTAADLTAADFVL